MGEIVIIIGTDKKGIIDALKVKSTLEKVGIDVKGVITKPSDVKEVPIELIEGMMKLKILDNIQFIDN